MYSLVTWKENGTYHEEVLDSMELMHMAMEEDIELIEVKPL